MTLTEIEKLAHQRIHVQMEATTPSGRVKGAAAALWPEPVDIEHPPPEPRRWVLLFLQPNGGHSHVRPVMATPEALTLLGDNRPDQRPPINLSEPIARHGPFAIYEAICLAWRFGLDCEFRYQPNAGPASDRLVTVCGIRDDLAFGKDHARGMALRSYKIDGISGFRATVRAPRWDGAGYSIPGQPITVTVSP